MQPSTILLAVALATLAAPAKAASPDFSTSRAEHAPVPAIAGDVLRYDVNLINSGAAVPYVRVTVTLPPGFLIGSEGDCSRAAYDPERPGFVWHEGPFPSGARQRCIVDLLTRREAAGTLARLAVEINA